ncbi:MAG TPA: hypothetical protein VF179_01950 [Thermoanaerobaculia bacterium]|nr:hypothetical protein [Thermoanaerobaculia bacterium]
MPRILIASPHRYPDLARLWYRFVARDLVPVLEKAGHRVEVMIFRDAHVAEFDPERFPGAVLEAPGPGVRDFLEFYDAALALDSDFLFLLDADLFFLDAVWAAGWMACFKDRRVAAVSLLRRGDEPGVYALLSRASSYRALPKPVFAPAYENLDDARNTVNRQPGDVAARRLRERGKQIVYANPEDAEERIADFHGTTVIRASREVFGHLMDVRGFEELVSRKRYFAMGAYDNALLGALYQALFDEPFAPGPEGEPLGGSVTTEAVRRELGQVRDVGLKKVLSSYFDRSDKAILRLAACEGIEFTLPALRPESWRRP